MKIFLLIILSFCGLTGSAQSSKDRDNAIFEQSKGHWKYPVAENMKVSEHPSAVGCGPSSKMKELDITSPKPFNIQAVFDGQVLGIVNDEISTLIVGFGEYIVVYYGLDTINFKNKDFIKKGQILGRTVENYEYTYSLTLFLVKAESR